MGRRATTLLITATLTACISCSSQPSKDQMPPTCGPEFENVESSSYYVSRLNLPDEEVGLNIDGEHTRCDSGCITDGDWGEDNRLGLLVEGFESAYELDFFRAQSFVEYGRAVMLLTVRNALDSKGNVACMDVIFHNGVDTDADPSDNASGTEHFDVTSDSVLPGTLGPLDGPSFIFGEGVRPHDDRHWSFKEATMEGVLDLHLERSDGSPRILHANTAMLSLKENEGHLTGIVGGAVPVLEITSLLEEAFDNACVDLESCEHDSFIVWTKSHADIDFLLPGQTSDACEDDEDCPGPDQECNYSGFCVEPEGGMDSISFAFEFEAVPCVIDGVADE